MSDSVVVTSKHNDDDQYVWESDSSSFTVTRDPRGNTLGRGTCVTLKLKEEAHDYLEQNTIKDLVKKYSQFINFNIYLWDSKVRHPRGWAWVGLHFAEGGPGGGVNSRMKVQKCRWTGRRPSPNGT